MTITDGGRKTLMKVLVRSKISLFQAICSWIKLDEYFKTLECFNLKLKNAPGKNILRQILLTKIRRVSSFLNIWPFSFFLIVWNNRTIYLQINVKMILLARGAGFWTHKLSIAQSPPITTRPGLPPKRV